MLTEEIRLLLGDAAGNFSDAQINLAYRMALAEVEAYCRRAADVELELIAERITILKLNRLGTEGLASQSYSGISESYIDSYPADILAILNRKRKVKFL